ncbi:ATP-binding cassette domain-containing protein [Longispora albida]|uniref:ATP-binding cassette domain-containing protein n=1 Tax=Longispora albida TaxID=203523 RepID=UPI0003A731B1|nr:ATP-binding cassette domain-containing protein [Longispora albida]
MIVEAAGLGKSFGSKRAVDEVSFVLEPGRVTGFLGPNGSGKSTTMRLMLGLDHGDGRTLYDGRQLAEHPVPGRVAGAHLDAKSFHPNRTARAHLRMLAAGSGVRDHRVDEVIEQVGLGTVAGKRPRGFSLGMGQRLGLASAILAEPAVLLLDEPANGLDPQSIAWLRDFIRAYASHGKVVFVSSHLMSEMQLMADDLVVIGRGRLIAHEPLAAFVARSTRNDVLVRVPDPVSLLGHLLAEGLSAVREGPDGVAVSGTTTEKVGEVAFHCGQPVRELTTRTASLEQAFLELTSDHQEYAAQNERGPGGVAG